jgi:S1-C subfamily serine protease
VILLMIHQGVRAQMVSSNVLQRVFQIKHDDMLGTAFTIDVDGRQYVITARHVVSKIGDAGEIQIRRETEWLSLPVKAFFPTARSIDIAVLAPEVQVSQPLPLHTRSTYYLSQDVYCCGFPYGLSMEGKKINAGFPIPFVKKGVVAALGVPDNEGQEVVVLDAINNPGFSGGPVVLQDTQTHQLAVIGVVSSFRFQEDKVIAEGKETGMTVRSNTGLTIVYPTKAALDVIHAHRVGFELHEERK